MNDVNYTRAGTAVALSLLLAACAGMSYAPVKYSNGLMTGANGMTLYTFDKDAIGSGKSACNGQCATNWPPLIVIGAMEPSGGYTVVTRDDGRKQWAYKGRPLYFWAKDAKPGDTTGDNVNNVWHIARP